MARGRTVLGLDPGSRRIGVAVSDPEGRMALPLEVVRVDDDWKRRIAEIVEEKSVSEVVVGLPRNLDGSLGPAAEAARRLAADLKEELEIPVTLVDERLTTVAAERRLRDTDLSGRARRRVVDQVAAAELLQGYLDGSGA